MVFWKTKEWWIAVIVAVLPLINHLAGTVVDQALVIAIVLPIIGLILGFDWSAAAEARRVTAKKK